MIDTTDPQGLIGARVLITAALDTEQEPPAGHEAWTGVPGTIVRIDTTSATVVTLTDTDWIEAPLSALTVTGSRPDWRGIDPDSAAHVLFRYDGTGYPAPSRWKSRLLRLIAQARPHDRNVLAYAYPGYCRAQDMVDDGHIEVLRLLARGHR